MGWEMKRRGANGLGNSGAMYGANNSQLMYSKMGIISNLKDETMKSIHYGTGDEGKRDKPGLITHRAVRRSPHMPEFILAARKILCVGIGELEDSDPAGLSSYMETKCTGDEKD